MTVIKMEKGTLDDVDKWLTTQRAVLQEYAQNIGIKDREHAV